MTKEEVRIGDRIVVTKDIFYMKDGSPEIPAGAVGIIKTIVDGIGIQATWENGKYANINIFWDEFEFFDDIINRNMHLNVDELI